MVEAMTALDAATVTEEDVVVAEAMTIQRCQEHH
jgi:hypothetical protein